MDKKNLAIKKRISGIDKKIDALKDKISEETALVAKSILILMENDLILKKNEIKEKVCQNQKFMDYFTKVNETTIADNKEISERNSEILQANHTLKQLFNLTKIHCLKEILGLARNLEITEIPRELKEYII